MSDVLEAVTLDRTTARVEDRVVVGGVLMRIVNVVRTISGMRLDLEEGERLWLTSRSRLVGWRDPEEDPDAWSEWARRESGKAPGS